MLFSKSSVSSKKRCFVVGRYRYRRNAEGNSFITSSFDYCFKKLTLLKRIYDEGYRKVINTLTATIDTGDGNDMFLIVWI